MYGGLCNLCTNASGGVIEQLSYGAFGKRRNADGSDATTQVLPQNDRGYTGHEMPGSVGLIPMNGRVYDPQLGRFLSADPYLQAAGLTLSVNRYADVLNNPLVLTDPSGYSWLSNTWKKLWRNEAFRIGLSFAAAWWTGGAMTELLLSSGNSALVAGALYSEAGGAVVGGSLTTLGTVTVGAAGGFAGSLVSSGGDVKSAAQGALTGGMMGWAGTVGGAGVEGANSAARLGAHALAGCVGGAVDGSGCGRGAASAVVGKFATNLSQGLPQAGQFAISAVAGGTASVITGGKFANGARTAAYGYLFNELLHEGSRVEAMTRSGYTLEGVNLPGVGDTYLDPRMAAAVKDWISLSSDQGVDIRFNSAFRISGEAVTGAVFTPAGDTSLHNAGLAVDVRYDRLTDIPGGLTGDQQRSIIRSSAAAAGLSWGGSFGDRVHFFIDPYGSPGPNRSHLIQTQQDAYRFLKGK